MGLSLWWLCIEPRLPASESVLAPVLASWPERPELAPPELRPVLDETHGTPGALTHPYLLALQRAHDETGQHPGLLACIGWRESKGDDQAIGRAQERGVVQLHPAGELPEFWRRGFDDPSEPAQAFVFLGQRISEGDGRAWATWRGCS